MKPAIYVENLSKLYHIGLAQQRHDTLRDLLVDSARGLRRRFARRTEQAPDELWALKDISFEVQPGEVVGIIGRNGAGKSTLLKILSRITEPTSGRAVINGRVGSLLEVGTGFHPELTGRENIYLNGAILGMRRAEIARKFDEIVAFSEIEKFLDTPVKRYSSGMYVRLAFAVAAHLQTEILLVDEVLAVGDAEFQQKCLGKMGSVASEGRTVLFVSHNMTAIKYLCTRAILVAGGLINYDAHPNDVVSYYMNIGSPSSFIASRDIQGLPRTRGDGAVQLKRISLKNAVGEPAVSFAVWEPFVITLDANSAENSQEASFWILVQSFDGGIVMSTFQYDSLSPFPIENNTVSMKVNIDPNELAPGTYTISVGAFGKRNEFHDWVDHAIKFEVRKEFYPGKPFDDRLGQTTVRYQWNRQ